MSTRRFQQACCAALFAAGCSADPGVECQRRAPGVAQQMAAMVATHQSGCTSAPTIVEAAVCSSGTCARGRADGGLVR